MKKFVSLGDKNQVFQYFGLVLKPLQFEDMEEIRKWRNDQMDVLRQKEKITINQQNKYYKEVVYPTYNQKRPPIILFGLQNEDSEEIIAYGGLVYIDWKLRISEVSFLCKTNYINTKMYTKILQAFINGLAIIAKERLSFIAFYSETFDFRVEHIKILEKCNFFQFGFKKNTTLKDGHLVNSLLHQRLL